MSDGTTTAQPHFYNGTGADPLCGFCGRPVIGETVYGNAGVYHPECVHGPNWKPFTFWPASPCSGAGFALSSYSGVLAFLLLLAAGCMSQPTVHSLSSRAQATMLPHLPPNRPKRAPAALSATGPVSAMNRVVVDQWLDGQWTLKETGLGYQAGDTPKFLRVSADHDGYRISDGPSPSGPWTGRMFAPHINADGEKWRLRIVRQ